MAFEYWLLILAAVVFIIAVAKIRTKSRANNARWRESRSRSTIDTSENCSSAYLGDGRSSSYEDSNCSGGSDGGGCGGD